MVMNNLRVACLQSGDLDRAAEILSGALELHRQTGTMSTSADIFINLSDVMIRRGKQGHARSFFNEAIELYRQADDPKGLHNAYYSIGCEEVEEGNQQKAHSAFAESLRYADRGYNPLGVAGAIEQIAGLATSAERAAEAARLAGAAQAIRGRIGTKVLPGEHQFIESLHSELRRSLGKAGFETELRAGSEITQRKATSIALALAEWLSETTLNRPKASVLRPAEAPASSFRLTKREFEVLRLLAEGRTNRDIASALFISPRTAGTHVANILGKLDVDTRAAAVGVAFRHHLI